MVGKERRGGGEPGRDIRLWPEIGEPADITFAAVRDHVDKALRTEAGLSPSRRRLATVPEPTGSPVVM